MRQTVKEWNLAQYANDNINFRFCEDEYYANAILGQQIQRGTEFFEEHQ